jgi:hypothetical protein
MMQSDGASQMTLVLVNVKRSEKMPPMSQETRRRVREYVQECTGDGKNWENNADSIIHLLDNGRLISTKDIAYAEDGSIAKIRGTEVVDGVLLLKEKKKPLKATTLTNNTPIPFIEKLRAQRKVNVP